MNLKRPLGSSKRCLEVDNFISLMKMKKIDKPRELKKLAQKICMKLMHLLPTF